MLALLLACVRVLAVVLALGLLTYALRGDLSSLERLAAVPGSIGEVITTNADTEARQPGRMGPAQLQRRLQELFAHRATLMVRFMRSTVSGDPGFVDAANAVVVRNTDDLRTALAEVVPTDDAVALADGWQSQTQALFGYAAGLRDDDDAARREARSAITASVEDQTALLTSATQGRLARDDVSASLRMQVDLLRFQIDAYATGDHVQAYELEREAYTQMYPLAADLAAGATGSDPDTRRPLAEMISQLSSLLGLHTELSVDAMRAGVAGEGEELAAAAGALDDNGRQVSAAFDAVAGTRPSRRFSNLWTTQNELLLRYAEAVGDDDADMRRRLRGRLRTNAARIGRVVASVSSDDADATATTKALRAQHSLLIGQAEAYARGDHADAHDGAYTAHGQANRLAHDLARILITGLPKGGAQTGGGGTARGD